MSARTVEVLREARRLIAERGWTQGEYARDAAGRACEPVGATPRCYCSIGALIAASQNDGGYAQAFGALLSAIGNGVVAWNDEPRRSVEDVLRAFDRAIAAAEASK